MLHPKYKLSYFRKKKWPEDWVDAERTVLREQWNTYYKPHNDSNTEPSQLDSVCDNFFTELDNFGTETTIDELKEYLNTPTISTKGLRGKNDVTIRQCHMRLCASRKMTYYYIHCNRTSIYCATFMSKMTTLAEESTKNILSPKEKDSIKPR